MNVRFEHFYRYMPAVERDLRARVAMQRLHERSVRGCATSLAYKKRKGDANNAQLRRILSFHGTPGY